MTCNTLLLLCILFCATVFATVVQHEVNVSRTNADRPWVKEEVRDRIMLLATETMPERIAKSLREHKLDASSFDYDHKPLKKNPITMDIQQLTLDLKTIDHYQPRWLNYTFKPKKAISGGSFNRVMYRGREVDPLTVFAPDDRRKYNDLSYPWGSVCKIITNAGRGSGVIIGPRHVLTASHVIDWNLGPHTVEVHRAGSQVRASVAATNVVYYDKITGPNIGWTEVDEDYAVLVTAERIGEWFGYLGAKTYDSSWDDDAYWYNIGYAGDLGMDMPIWQGRVALDEDALDFGSARGMGTRADTFKGQSGGPMFGFWSAGPYVVAVVSSQDDDENHCSGGSLLTTLVKKARDQYP